MANIYLHYALDQWVHQWRGRHARGDVIVVRYADDFVIGFQHMDDAERLHADLKERLNKFSLELSVEKTRLIEFGRFAEQKRSKQGLGRPETFNFLGFVHICGKTRNGKFCVLRNTMAKKVRSKLAELKTTLRKQIHQPTPMVGAWLQSVLSGHYRYYGVPRNYRAMAAFRHHVVDMWRKILRRRGNKKNRVTWERMTRIANRWLPRPRIMHPYPTQRLVVTTQGRSPVR